MRREKGERGGERGGGQKGVKCETTVNAQVKTIEFVLQIGL